jgi:hypothetical protein
VEPIKDERAREIYESRGMRPADTSDTVTWTACATVAMLSPRCNESVTEYCPTSSPYRRWMTQSVSVTATSTFASHSIQIAT